MDNQDEIILYQPDKTVKIEVRMEDETVWLTQAQISELFQRDRTVITRHINNVFKEHELDEKSNVHFLHIANSDKPIKMYSLDVIISVGYRVKSLRGTQFRQWANKVLKDFLLKGYSINNRMERLEQRVAQTEDKIDFFVRTTLPPIEGIFYNGQIFDAYKFVANLVKSAQTSIILIDNYVDESVLTLLDKRNANVTATIYTQRITAQLQLDIDKHNTQYPPIQVDIFNLAHDRFLLIDEKVYHLGASVKDLGKKWFAFALMSDITVDELLAKIKGVILYDNK
ncbi:RhuM family protein [Bacteroides sp. CG01]|uniref:RhuM family protein n=2 Tax=Bacteroides TaxID=816 RepID=UPI002AFF9B82|nr:RhuM family protein [Bacteroides sp. CG01]